MPLERKALAPIICIGDIPADADAYKFAILYSKEQIRIEKIRMATSSDHAAADTNYQSIKVMNGVTVICSWITGPAAGGVSFTKGEWVAKDPLTTEEIILAGGTLNLEFAKTGTGMAIDGLTLHIQTVQSPSAEGS